MEFGELSLYGNTIKLWAAFGLCGPVISTCDRGHPLPVRGCPGCRDPAQLFHSLASMPLSCKRAPFNCCDGRFSFFPIHINGLGSLADPCPRSEFQSIPRYCKVVKILGSVFPLVPRTDALLPPAPICRLIQDCGHFLETAAVHPENHRPQEISPSSAVPMGEQVLQQGQGWPAGCSPSQAGASGSQPVTLRCQAPIGVWAVPLQPVQAGGRGQARG